MANIEGVEVEWLGHDSFCLKADSKVVYIDPYKLAGGEPADLILITHDHFDHCDQPSVDRIVGKDTIVIAPFGCSVKLRSKFRQVSAGETVTEKGVKVEAVAAYNIGKPYHPRGIGVGYVITLAGKRIYHAGDTDRIPEMKKLRNIDIALLPVSGTYTMTAVEAAEAANEDIDTKAVVPMHYGSIVGTKNDAETFKGRCKRQVFIL